MDISKEEQQRKQFKDILFELSENQSMLQDKGKRAEMYRRLENLYYNKDSSKKFRHYYSDIFQVLDEIKQHPEKGNRSILGQNLDVLRQGYQAKNINDNGDLIDISDSIRKLYDHVNLEIARMDYSDAGDWRISQEEKLQKVRARISELNDNVAQSTEKMDNASKEYIAILGIFASIIVTFIGGITFSTSILGAINLASVYRVSLLAVLMGLVLINVLYGLFTYVDRLVNGPKLRSIKPLIIANAIFIGLLILIILGWAMGLVEIRNAHLPQ